jgi:glycosyltransferase involved in cell wall biosynthesis
VAGVQDDEVAARFGLTSGAPVVLAVGGIEERKNAVRLLQAFSSLRRQYPRARLVMAGGASLLDHDEVGLQWRAVLASEPALASAVTVTGPVDDLAMPALYRIADVLAMPSLREGFGLAALEALASGTPVVVSRIAPFTEYLGDDDVSFADPLSVQSIADAIERALARRHAAPHVDSAALFDRFNWPASAARHASLYRQAAASTAS